MAAPAGSVKLGTAATAGPAPSAESVVSARMAAPAELEGKVPAARSSTSVAPQRRSRAQVTRHPRCSPVSQEISPREASAARAQTAAMVTAGLAETAASTPLAKVVSGRKALVVMVATAGVAGLAREAVSLTPANF